MSESPALRKAADLMERYANATLLLLADHVAAYDVLTLDRRGFSTYRTDGNRSLRLLLDLRA